MVVFGMRKVRKRMGSVLWEGFCGTGRFLWHRREAWGPNPTRVKSWQGCEEVMCIATQRVAELEIVKGE